MDEILGILALLALVAGLVLWIYSGIHAFRDFGKRGGRTFIYSLLLFLVSIGVLWGTIVVPVLDCRGFLCGLGEILLFMGLSGVVFVIWPIVYLAYLRAAVKRAPKSTSSTEIIDNDLL